MAFTVQCTHCDSKLKLKNESAIGRKIRCPKCEMVFVAELESPAPTETKSPAAAEDDWLNDLNEIQPPATSQSSDFDDPDLETVRPKAKKKPSPKKKRQTSQSSGMNLGPFGWILGGGVAGLLGALVWGGVAYATQYELGILAWGIGVVVGIGVAVGAGDRTSGITGIGAAIIALGSVALGKALMVYLLLHSILGGAGGAGLDLDELPPVDDSFMISTLANEIVETKESNGEEIDWPAFDEQAFENQDPNAPYDYSQDYPKEIWEQAEKAWNELPADQQEVQIAEQQEMMEGIKGMKGAMFYILYGAAFVASFGLFDLLWAFLAASSAFKIGSGSEE